MGKILFFALFLASALGLTTSVYAAAGTTPGSGGTGDFSGDRSGGTVKGDKPEEQPQPAEPVKLR